MAPLQKIITWATLICLLCPVLFLSSPSEAQTYFSVDRFGARGDGLSDDTQAFLRTWAAACRAPERAHPVMVIPRGRSYALGAITFRGPCTRGLVYQLQGTLVSNLRPGAANTPYTWIRFLYVSNMMLNGGGIVDGQGYKWWVCKKQKNCSATPPAAMGMDFGTNVVIQDLRIVNSPRVHLALFASTQVTMERLSIDSPHHSPNTDGIQMGMCSAVLIRDCNIRSGDDCVAMVDGNNGVRVERSVCGPGHGISIGSLGGNHTRIKPVTNIQVNGVTFRNTDNGVRIKTWQGGQGFVRGVSYTNIVMENVRNPIIIDQFYCATAPGSCRNYSEAVQISNVTYSNIRGTTPSAEAIKLACSSTVPCTDLLVQNVHLRRAGSAPFKHHPPARLHSFCNNAHGRSLGEVVPALSCLMP